MTIINSHSTLDSRAPGLDETDAEKLARELYGFSGTARLLTAERDKNFLLEAEDGLRLVLKVSNPAEDRLVTNFQTSAMLHLELTSPHLMLPRIVRARDGSVEVDVQLPDGRKSVARMLTYIPGIPLYTLPRTPLVRRDLGALLAELDLGLAGFSHEAQSHELQWDLMRLPQLAGLLEAVELPQARQVVEKVIEDFNTHVLPSTTLLRKQVIYNDLNFYNVLMSSADHEKIEGIIDFGDIIHAPLVNDVCVAATYHFLDTDDPFQSVGELIATYHRRLPLLEQEIELIPDLIAARMATTILISSWRARLYPENGPYILRNAPVSQVGLALLTARSRWENLDWIHTVCREEA
ncbi:MAG: phosphotransferase [Devosia sp.]